VGIGDIGTEHLWSKYADPGWNPEGHLHNNVIMWLVTLGLVGCSALVGLFVTLWKVMSSIERSLQDDWFLGSLSLGSLAVVAGFHVNGLFEWNFGDAEIIMLIWAVAGLTLSADRISRGESRP
jgi:O-antigen ligase